MNSEIEGENGDESNELKDMFKLLSSKRKDAEKNEDLKDPKRKLDYARDVLDDFAKAAYKAFKSNTNAQLFVYVLNMNDVETITQKKAVRSSLEDQENPDYVIYYFTKIENATTVIPVPLNYNNFQKLMNIFNEIKNSVKNLAENEAVKHGKNLYICLTGNKEVLQPRECNSSYGVWINCKDEDIDPLWEWLYTKSEDFFWGDEFSIIRIPKNCDFEDQKYQVKEAAILLDADGLPARTNKSCLSNICNLKTVIELHDPEIKSNMYEALTLNELKDPDCIHIALDIKTVEDVDLRTKVRTASENNNSKTKGANNKKFLFLNVSNSGGYKCDELHAILSEWITLIPAKTWICTNLDVPPDFATSFASCFYEICVKEGNVAKAVRKAREEIGKGYLFSTIDRNLEDDLKRHTVTQGSRDIFDAEGFELPTQVSVSITEENEKWTIKDNENENTYIVIKKDGKLNIYEKKRDLKSFFRFAYLVTGNPCNMITWTQ